MTRNLRIQLADLAEQFIRAARGHVTRERAADLMSDWDLLHPLDDEVVAEVLSRFPAAEPSAVPGLDFLPPLFCLECKHAACQHTVSYGCIELGCSCLADPPAGTSDAKTIVAEVLPPVFVAGSVVTPDMRAVIDRARATRPGVVLTASVLNEVRDEMAAEVVAEPVRVCDDCGHPEARHSRLNCDGAGENGRCWCYAFRLPEVTS